MKKLHFLLFLLLAVTVANAAPVSLTTAQTVAQNFCTTQLGQLPTLSLTYTEKDASGQALYYIFNVNTNKGFVIVSAEDATYPVIAYSNEGPYVIPAKNNNVDFWMQKTKNEIAATRTRNLTAPEDITAQWKQYISANTNNEMRVANVVVGPLCKTIWDQSPYFNAMCPGGSVTGCVATGMAQVMRYWNYPAKGIGSHCYDDTSTDGFSENYGQLCAYFDTTNYKWSAMSDTVNGPNNAIALLMYDCGVSVEMDYTPYGSGSSTFGYAPSALNSYTAYFGYDAASINTAVYTDYTVAQWTALLENELNDRRVMQMGGIDTNAGGHSWVCDGYNSSNQFHMNWGWSGQDNGYYYTSSLNPGSYDFSTTIRALYGIKPPGALGVQQISANNTISVYPNPSHGVFNVTKSTSGMVKVYNMLGQQVCTSELNTENNKIDLSIQPKGMYLYTLSTEEGEFISSGKLVVE